MKDDTVSEGPLAESRLPGRDPAPSEILRKFQLTFLFLVACALVSCHSGNSGPSGQTSVAPEQGEPAQENATIPPPQGEPAQENATVPPPVKLQEPPGGWLKDDKGREYFVDRCAKNQAVRVDSKHVRGRWGFPLDVVREDDQFYYYKVYKPITQPPPAPPQPPESSLEDQRKVLESYRANVQPSDRLLFTPFREGLPASGQWRQGFAIADVNGDGHPDIILPPPRKSGSAVPVIFLGNGKGSWSRWSEAKFPPRGYDYGDVQVGDFNGDGIPDLAFGVHLRGQIVLLGDGKGGFRDASQGLDFGLGGKVPFSSQALKIVDWDGNGRSDILALAEGPAMVGGHTPVDHSRGVVLYVNQGNGKWEARSLSPKSDLYGVSLAVGNFDGSGHLGFVTSTNVMDRRDLVNLWQPNGGIKTVTVNELRPMAYVWAVAAADFEGKGRTDLAVAYSNVELGTWRSGIDILYPRTDEHWERRTLVSEETQIGPIALATGDLDGDGHKDLVALTSKGEILVFLGNRRGFFTQERTPPPAYPGGCRGAHVELADLDHDGRDELVAAFSDQRDESGHCPSEGGLTAWKAQLKR
jgi:hypothetical protein